MRKPAKSNIQEESFVLNMCLICLHLTQRVLAARFFVGFISGILFTVIIYHIKEPITQTKFRHDQSKFEYEKNQQLTDSTNVIKSSVWNNSWDG